MRHGRARTAFRRPLVDAAVQDRRIVEARPLHEADRVFPVQVSHHTLHKDFEAAGIPGKGAFHRFRKGGITACVEAGVPLADLAKLSRHANVSVLVQSYYVPADPVLRKAQAALRLGAA